MTINLGAAARLVPLTALMLGACVSQSAYDQVQVQNKQLQTQLDRDQSYSGALQTQINALSTDFVNRDDPAQRAIIEQNRQKAAAGAGRLQADQHVLGCGDRQLVHVSRRSRGGGRGTSSMR